LVLTPFDLIGGYQQFGGKMRLLILGLSPLQNIRPEDRGYNSSKPAFIKLWSADHKWSSGSTLVVLLD
jgi:hypothetical protein